MKKTALKGGLNVPFYQ